MGRLVRRGLLVLLLVALLAGVVVVRHYTPLLRTGTGYAAHNACAVRMLAGRDAGAPDRDLPDNPLVPYLRTSVDAVGGSATTTVMGRFFGQTAWYTPGHGCTLAERRPSFPAVDSLPPADTWKAGDDPVTGGDKIRDAVDAAFGEDPVAQARLGTRAIVVVHDGKIVAERYATGFTPRTRQLGWSMTKSVANLMTGALEQQGVLSRTDTKLFAQWRDDRKKISVTDLLRMTSGLRWDETYDLGTPITEMLYLREDMGAYAASLPLEHDPGTYQQYSSGSTNVLCQYLQQRSGLGPDIGRRLLFDTLGMTSAVLEPDAAGHPVCSSYLWATPRDWALLGQLALQNGLWDGRQLLPSDWMSFSTTPLDVRTEDEGESASWWVNRRADGTLRFAQMPADTYWASGHDGQRLVVVPSADLVVVRLGFTPDGGDTGFDTLVGSLAEAVGGDG